MNAFSTINKYLKTDIYDIKTFKTVNSTNTMMKEYAMQGASEFSVLISEHQTNGRGRLGREFFSPDKSGIYMSILLRPKLPPEKALLLTTAAAVACAKAIEKASGKNTFIKWVNDIYLNERKVCGILTEASIHSESKFLSYAVVGIGINVFPPENDFPTEIINKAGSVFSQKSDENLRAKLAAEVLNEFSDIYPLKDVTDFIEEYRKRDFLAGKEINILSDTATQNAVAIGIDDNFNLIARLSDGKTVHLGSGDVSIRF